MAKKIIQGRDLMLFDANSVSYAYATNHTLTLTAETSDVTSKDHGENSAIIISKYTWEITSENLFTVTDYDELFDKMVTGEKITVCFGRKVDEGDKTVADGDLENWGLDISDYYQGSVIITSLTANANNGENATLSVTLTGTGRIKNAYNWKDITKEVFTEEALSFALTEDGKVSGWNFNATDAKLSDSNYIVYKDKYVVWRNNGTDCSICYEATLPTKGKYRFTIDFYNTYEPNLSTERIYGVCFTDNYNNLMTDESKCSILVGKSTKKLTDDDLSVVIDGVTYYLPNRGSEASLDAHFATGKYRHTVTYYTATDNQKMKIRIGQTHGGTKTNVVYGLPKIEFIKK